MLFTQDTKSSHPMTKDALGCIMENRHYFAQQIEGFKKTPKKEQILSIILANYPQKQEG